MQIDARITYDGNPRSKRSRVPHYFDRLRAKYDHPSRRDPEFLRRYFPDESVWGELRSYRTFALNEFIGAASLQVRTSPRGWHGQYWRRELQRLGGTLARIQDDRAKAREAAETRKKIAAIRRRHLAAVPREIEDSLSTARFFWRSAMFLCYEFFPRRSGAGGRRLSPKAVDAICAWLSFPELGVRCTRDVLRASRRYFRVDPKTRTRSYSLVWAERAESKPADGEEADKESLQPFGLFTCRLCGRSKIRQNKIGEHLESVHAVRPRTVTLDASRRRLFGSTGEVVATWRDDKRAAVP